MPKEREQVNGAPKRDLPKRRNPEMAHPVHSELIKTRRLGQTTLGVKPGQVGTSNATKPENLGPFDYAHLRAPLPKELEGSEIHAHHPNQTIPKFYFLMRRSSDGFVSATGMFKAAFPWAKIAEENAERDYIKELPSTAHDEVAGNVWVSEHYAIELAQEYGISPWVAALLDDTPIPHTSEDPSAMISPPPKFKFTAGDKPHLPPPNGTSVRASTPKARGRPRGASPAKHASPAKSSKKPRATKATKEADAATARDASATLQATLDDAASVTPSESVDGEKVKVEVESNVEKKGDTETTTTNVKIEMPSGSIELPLPESPEEMIERAKEMVEEARKIDGESSSSKSKRKAEELDEDSDEAENEPQPAKRTRLLEQQLKTEKVRNRAMIGVAATLALGAIIPFVLPG